jgi:hypothetical protein
MDQLSSSDADRAQLLDTGNLVIKGKGDIFLWQSFDSPTDTLLPNKHHCGYKVGINSKITCSWPLQLAF